MTSPDPLAELLELTARKLHSRGHSAGLFPAQWSALRYFARADVSLRTSSELARFQGLANGPVSRTVRTLVQKGLLVKAQNQPKGRAELLELTEAGNVMLGRDPSHDLEAAVSVLSPDERDLLTQSLQIIVGRLP